NLCQTGSSKSGRRSNAQERAVQPQCRSTPVASLTSLYCRLPPEPRADQSTKWFGGFKPVWNVSTDKREEVVLAAGCMQTHMMLSAEPSHFQWCRVVVVMGVDSRTTADLTAALDQFSGGQRPLDRK